jgi:hypothetical protein
MFSSGFDIRSSQYPMNKVNAQSLEQSSLPAFVSIILLAAPCGLAL